MPLVIIVLAAFGLVLVAHVVLREKPTGELIGVSHRGAAGLAPENTLAAVRAGIAHGMRAIEIESRGQMIELRIECRLCGCRAGQRKSRGDDQNTCNPSRHRMALRSENDVVR